MASRLYCQLLLLLALAIFASGHIYSAKPQVTYNYDGKPWIYHLFIELETGLGADDYLKITMPEVIHETVKN